MADTRSTEDVLSRKGARSLPSIAIRTCLPHLSAAGAFSGAINLLYLATPLYLLQVYNRVLPSRSGATLILLTVGLGLALATMAVLDAIRARILIRAGTRFDIALAPRILAHLVHQRLDGRPPHSDLLRDLDLVRQTLSGVASQTVFDLPWTPVYLALLFSLHFTLGWMALFAALFLLTLALLADRLSRPALASAHDAHTRSYRHADEMLRNADPILAMGMQAGLGDRWLGDRALMLAQSEIAGERNATFAAAIRFLRLLLQSGMLGAGAWLVIRQEINAASIFVAMVLMGRAVAPVEQVVSAGRQIAAARSAWRRLNEFLQGVSATTRRTRLPSADGSVKIEDVIFAPSGGLPVIRGVSLAVHSGEALGIVGPSAAGKSTIVRLMTGALSPTSGRICLNGADIRHWDRAQLGRSIGYLPQEVGLLAGSVRDNIARFGATSDEEIVRAAQRADVHDMILDLPQGYDTFIGDGGVPLSGGQRQRLGLARAILGRPRLLVLDEPNANLDGEGELALKSTLVEMKAEGATIVIVAHRPGIVEICDNMLVLQNGAVLMHGPRAEVLDAVRRQFVRAVDPSRPETRARAI
jgi:ATP-binding cassette, subfamily C, bacterial exporter for protease/lipase